MYYQNGNYMQDLNYYNQTPNYGFNPYVANNYQGMSNNHNMNNNLFQMQNLSAMYPAVYRIISPVVSQVLANSNVNYLTEDSLNNMVDMVYDIVEGDVNVTNNANASNSQNDNSNNYERNSNTNSQRTNNNTSATTSSQRQNPLLKDLIKIMILNEIVSKRQNNQMMMPNNMNPQMFM